MPTIYILLGGNIGDRIHHLSEARRLIAEQCGEVTATSSIYETKAWGVTNQPDFLNQVIIISSDLEAAALLGKLETIEIELGRERHQRWHERTIDIDILYYNQEVIDTENLKVPHPQIAFRRFTLIPLAELSPDWVHPELGKTQSELLETCPDELEVWRLP